jgi:hypothetical protein
MILKLPPLRKKGRTSELNENRPMTNARPRNGPNAFRSRPGVSAPLKSAHREEDTPSGFPGKLRHNRDRVAGKLI